MGKYVRMTLQERKEHSKEWIQNHQGDLKTYEQFNMAKVQDERKGGGDMTK